jgi:serine/threonine-protein kinase RsbW
MTALGLQLTLKSDPQNLSEVEPFVHGLVKEYQISEHVFGNVLIAVTEAVSNAMLHGNQSDSNKTVFLATKKVDNILSFTVEDQGKGFDPASLPDPTAPENILNPGGRGVFLMEQLADTVSFRDGGRVVQLDFCL